MTVQSQIETKIIEALAPTHLEVINESHMHSVPPGSESHFKLVIVSDNFDGVARVKRHQTVNRILAAELAAGLHALSLKTVTTGNGRKAAAKSPPRRPASAAARPGARSPPQKRRFRSLWNRARQCRLSGGKPASRQRSSNVRK